MKTFAVKLRDRFSKERRAMGACCAVWVLLAPAQANAQIAAAPDGDPTIVAQKIIRENFEATDCPLVVRAVRFGDGSIKAFCSNSEAFRVFRIQGKQVAMRCSAAKALGVSGC